MNQLPREVSAEVRSRVLHALHDPDGYIIDGKGRRYIRRLGFDPDSVVVEDLIDYLEKGCRLYILPDDPRKCQCCLRYEDDLLLLR